MKYIIFHMLYVIFYMLYYIFHINFKNRVIYNGFDELPYQEGDIAEDCYQQHVDTTQSLPVSFKLDALYT